VRTVSLGKSYKLSNKAFKMLQKTLDFEKSAYFLITNVSMCIKSMIEWGLTYQEKSFYFCKEKHGSARSA
jgi:hypothetical protein